MKRKLTCPLRRGRYLIFAAGCLIGSLLGAPAGAASFYESTKNVYHSVQGTDQKGVDIYTGAFRIGQTFGTIPSVLNIPAGWHFVSQDDTAGPFGKGTSTLTDVFVEWKAATNSYEFVGPGNRRFVLFRQGTSTPAVYADHPLPRDAGGHLHPDQPGQRPQRHAALEDGQEVPLQLSRGAVPGGR